MSRLIYAHDNTRTDMGEFTPENMADLIRAHARIQRGDSTAWDRAYAEAYPDDYLATYLQTR